MRASTPDNSVVRRTAHALKPSPRSVRPGRGRELVLRVTVVALAVVLLTSGARTVGAQSTVTVSTMTELRSAIGNAGVSTININPGTYLLTSSGSGQLNITRNLTITNTGGGRVVLDAGNASRVIAVETVLLVLTEITVTRGNGNAGADGGGIWVNSGTLRLIRSTVSGNAASSGKHGGGIGVNSGTLELINSTVSGNTAGGNGGGVWTNSGTVLVSNSTIASNTGASGGGMSRISSTVTLRNAIVADNTGGQMGGTDAITGQGVNLVEGGCTGCPAGTLTADPKLGPLADNGGLTSTHALLAGSPAIDAGANGSAEATDQRGVTRPKGTAADIGAFELDPATVAADLAISKTISNTLVNIADTIAYFVTVTNNGPATATNIVVTDTVASRLTYLSHTTTQGTYSTANWRWTVGTLTSGASATLTIYVRVHSSARAKNVTNTAWRTSADQADPTSSNNSASVTIAVRPIIKVSVAPDGLQDVRRLPSNGITYSSTFRVTNIDGPSSAPADFHLLASKRPGTALSILSVNGVAGDSTLIVSVAPGASVDIPVTYSLGAVANGTADTLQLLARYVENDTVANPGYVDLTVVRPVMALSKSVFPNGTVPAGTDIVYTLSFSNAGGDSAVSVQFVDPLPAAVTFKVGSVVTVLPSGLTAALAYSSDGGVSWAYTPTSGGCSAANGYDACVTHVRWTLAGGLSASSPNNAGELRFTARIE